MEINEISKELECIHRDMFDINKALNSLANRITKALLDVKDYQISKSNQGSKYPFGVTKFDSKDDGDLRESKSKGKPRVIGKPKEVEPWSNFDIAELNPKAIGIKKDKDIDEIMYTI